jgi:chromosome segregation protein
MEYVYKTYLNNNKFLIDHLEKSYQNHLIKYQELDNLILEKTNTSELESFNLTESHRIHTNNEIKDLEKKEKELENLKTYQLSLANEISVQISDLQKENQDLMIQMRSLQNQKQNLQSEKKKLFELFTDQLTKLKTKHKGELLITDERSKYLSNTKKDLDSDFINFQSQWEMYLEKVNDKKEDISEMISILEEELKNKNLKQQLERKKTVALNRKWIEESRKNKLQIKLWSDENQKLNDQILILKSQETSWLSTLKDKHDTLQKELQHNLIDLETKLKNKNTLILNAKGLIETSNKQAVIEHNRKIITDLHEEKVLLDDAYNIALQDLNRFYKTSDEEIKNNPFIPEIKKYQDKINKNLLSTEKIKKRETIIINQNKLYLKSMKSHLETIRTDIKDNYLQLDKINKTFINQEKRHQEEQVIYQNKFNTYYQNFNEENQYLDILTLQQQKEIDELKSLHNISIETTDFTIWDFQDQIDSIRIKSNQILLEIDQLNYKKNNLGRNEDLEIKEIQRKKTICLKELSKYPENPDLINETLLEVRDLLRSKNEIENLLYVSKSEIESMKHKLEKTFENHVSVVSIINKNIITPTEKENV